MPPSKLAFSNPLVIAEEGKMGEGYRALIVGGGEGGRVDIHEAAKSQVWEEDEGYSEVMPVWQFLKLGRWQLRTRPLPWQEPTP